MRHPPISDRVADDDAIGLTLGGTVKGDPVKEIVKLAFDNGINFIDTAEGVSDLSRFAGASHKSFATGYASGQSEVEMSATVYQHRYNVADIHQIVAEYSRNSRSAGATWSFRPRSSSVFGENNSISSKAQIDERFVQGWSKCEGSVPKAVRLCN